MLYKLIYFFQTDLSWLNVFRYITFRTILSMLTALMIFLALFASLVVLPAILLLVTRERSTASTENAA